MIRDIDLRVLPEVAAKERSLLKILVHDHGVDPDTFRGMRIIRRSIDARQRTIHINLRVRVWMDETPDNDLFPARKYPDVSGSKNKAVVIGTGPGGLFAALRLIELGIHPIVLERGKPVRERKKDIANISREHQVNPESNYCFGEGGAGAFSDGKLYTRSKKRGNIERILHIFCHFGASPSILSDAHPHIGTDKLPGIIENMRMQILASGGEVHFETRMTDLILNHGAVSGVLTSDGREFIGPVILATGHSARDVYQTLHRQGIRQDAKPLAIGVRLEHPSALIDQIQYHNPKGRGEYLPAAEYSLVTQVEGRGVYSFCMCPGGFVVPAASGSEQIVVNGMSPSHRNSLWSNAGLVVEIQPEDLNPSKPQNNPYGIGTDSSTSSESIVKWLDEKTKEAPELLFAHWQEHLERCCWQHGEGRQTAPSQRMNDFVEGKPSATLPSTSYSPGIVSSELHEWLPSGIIRRLREGFRIFDRSNKGFLSNEALLLGIETRTSSPVRITRDPETLAHVETKGLYPCGEGAGYAGGIVSAAIDGERCAEKLASTFFPNQ
jgi:uncharacterized protein